MSIRVFVIFLLLSVQLEKPTKKNDLLNKYNKAISYYNSEEPTAQTDSLALIFLTQIINDPARISLESKILIDAHEKAGNLHLINNDFEKAIVLYRRGLEFDYQNDFTDTLFFASNLFLGESYYRVSKADSSIHFLKNAERLLSKKDSKLEASRLYNSIGVIYYESGNYIQAINYFNQARDLSVGDRNFDELDEYFRYAEFSFLNNIGSSLTGLSQLDSALTIYQKMLSFGINTDRTLSQISEVYLKKQEPDSALIYLNLIQSDQIRNSISFQNQLAEVYYLRKEYKKASEILSGLVQSNANGSHRNFILGSTYMMLGKIAFEEQRFEDAVRFFHHSIIEIDDVFDNENIFQNPSDFSLGFATFQLFESVSGKAKSLIELYTLSQNERFRTAAIATYQTAFDIARHVSNYYDNDEARIFLADYVMHTYEDAIKFLYGLYVNSGNNEELELLFEWVEKSKATSLNLSLKEKRVKGNVELPADLLQKERDLQFSISRLQQQIAAADIEDQIDQLQAELRTKRLELSRLIDQINDIPEYMEAKLAEEEFEVEKIQNKLLDKNSAVISFFETKEEIFIFLLVSENLKVFKIEKTISLIDDLRKFKFNLMNFQPGVRYQKGGLGLRLNQQLFSNLNSQLSKYDNLMIIPDGILMDLPFAALEEANGSYWIEKFRISYQYSIEFLNQKSVAEKPTYQRIAFAPFSNTSWTGDVISLVQLPNSQEEIESVATITFSNKQASKEMFLEKANEGGILHLATHALPDPIDPSQAFIAFYPGDISSRLFTHEIYNLNLKNTSLVFLSACETNTGIISQSEGVLSISRAFSYAGCPNIITTLWKAEDLATAYLSTRFYHHLDKGRSFTEALQLSQLDLLKDPKMSQFHHPAFWSHLIFIGENHSEENKAFPYLIGFGLLLLIISIMLYYKKKNPSPKEWI